MKNYWLLKSEPTCYSIDDMQKNKKAAWTGIRNYQARNFMRDGMKPGDLALFYHSSAKIVGVYGVVRVASAAKPDQTALNKKDDHYDPKSTAENPIWYGVDVEFVQKFKEPVSLNVIKINPKLKGIMVAAKGSRLSVQPVSEAHFKEILEMAKS